MRTLVVRSQIVAAFFLVSIGLSAEAAPVNPYGTYQATSVTTGIQDHTFWLVDFLGGSNADRYWQFDGGQGTFVFSDGPDPDEARLTGTIVQNTNSDAKLDVDVTYRYRSQGPGLKMPKCGGCTGATDPANDWDFFDAVEGTLSGTGGLLDGVEVALTIRPDPELPGQMGFGANDKDNGLGFSNWAFWTVVLDPNNRLNGTGPGIGDINLQLAPEPGGGIPQVPIPGAGILLLSALGLGGGMARIRRKRLNRRQAQTTA